MNPALYLIPTDLGEAPLQYLFPPYNREVILSLRHFIVEEVRTSRRFLKRMDSGINIDALTFYPMGKHSDVSAYGEYLAPLRGGEPMGMISEAGCPAVADPGAAVVALAQREGLRVVPLVGPSSILMALMASGLNGQNFAFDGYLPIDEAQKTKALRRYEARALGEGQTQIFIEAPYRNRQFISLLLRTLSPHTRLTIASGVTTEMESIRTLSVEEWKKQDISDLNRIPAIFCIGK